MKNNYIFVLLLLFSSSCVYASSHQTLVWMCLEICNVTSATVNQHLQDVWAHKELLTYVSFEKYTLNSASSFTDFSKEFNLTFVGPLLPPGIKQLPMISSYPHPPEFLEYMQVLFKNPSPFIEAAIQEAIKYNYAGFNVDFEPTSTASDEDAKNYAEFLSTFADALHKVEKILTVDVASWNIIWNFTLIDQSSVDQIHSMDTYASKFNTFETYLQKATSLISPQKLGIGLEVYNFTQQDWSDRFDALKNANIDSIAIWDMPIPDLLWQEISTFMQN